jgi:hypothetical protein
LGSGQVHHISNQPPHHEPSIQPYLGQEFRYYEDAQHGNVEQMNQRHQMEAGTQNGSFAYWHKLGTEQFFVHRKKILMLLLFRLNTTKKF